MKNITPKRLNDFNNNVNDPEEYFLKLGANKPAEKSPSQEEWLTDDYEGQLAIDVYETPNNMVIKSAIAGVKPEDLSISITNDMLTIRGKREQTEEVKDDNYFYRECFWGGFSRSIILPTEVNTDAIDANLKNGVLTITLPKIKKGNSINIPVKGEEE